MMGYFSSEDIATQQVTQKGNTYNIELKVHKRLKVRREKAAEKECHVERSPV